MAIKSVLINKIRRKINDWADPRDSDATEQIYSDEYYTDAIDDSINRFNLDTGNSYSITTLPVSYDWLIVLLSQICMCQVRAAEVRSDSEALENVARVQVPDLETWFHTPKNMGAEQWLDLCEALEEKYADWLECNGFKDRDGDELPVAVSMCINRKDHRKGGALRNTYIDDGLTAPTDLLMAVSVSSRLFTWTPILDYQFCWYQLQRKLSSESWDEDTEVVVATIYENHQEEYEDEEVLVAETYTFRLAVANRNNIVTYSNEQTAVVT